MIELRRDDGFWTATINRPEKANSLTSVMLTELADIAEDAQDHAQVLAITGGGHKVFSAGADLDEARNGLATDPVWERLSSTLAQLDLLTIAALNGTLAGGAFGMALACDLRVAVPTAEFFYPVAKLGLLPQPSDPQRLRNLVGPARARLILMAGARLSAEEAWQFGLVDRIVAADELPLAVQALAGPALSAKPGHISKIKAMTRS
ncbi:MAG: enoyl-CoA hydratase/isomerase family protein [Pseudomonadota bacterium]